MPSRPRLQILRPTRPLGSLGRSAAARVALHARDRSAVLSRLNDDLSDISASGLAASTRVVYSSHVQFFHEYMTILGLDTSLFGLPVARGGWTPEEEETILAGFAVHVWRHPRRVRSGRTRNSGRHCQACVAAVRDWVYDEKHREVAPLSQARFLRLTLKGLRKRSPNGFRAPREPILRHHLAAVRDLLDLRGDQRHRVFWAFVLTAWQGVKRCGDLIAPKKVQGRPWDPRFCLHRGRLRVVPAYDASGRAVGRSLIIDNIPNKINPAGERKDESYFPVDHTPGALSAAVAIWDVLRHDPRRGPKSAIPLFVDPDTGLEITYSAVSSFLDYWLTRAGYPELATGTHALRAGGATSVANLCSDGHLLSGLMGNWSSSAQYQYLWAMRHRLEEAAREIGRAGGGVPVLAARPGPIGRLRAGAGPSRGGARGAPA
jgi:hypothetical protein